MKFTNRAAVSERLELLFIQRELLVCMRNHLSRRFLCSPRGAPVVPSIRKHLQTLDREIAVYIAQIEAETALLQAAGAEKTVPAGLTNGEDFVDSRWIKALALIQAGSCIM